VRLPDPTAYALLDGETIHVQLHTGTPPPADYSWGYGVVRRVPQYTAVQGPPMLIAMRDELSGAETAVDATGRLQVCNGCGRPLLPTLGAPDAPTDAVG
jgi:hypothetical protein